MSEPKEHEPLFESREALNSTRDIGTRRNRRSDVKFASRVAIPRVNYGADFCFASPNVSFPDLEASINARGGALPPLGVERVGLNVVDPAGRFDAASGEIRINEQSAARSCVRKRMRDAQQTERG